MEKRNRIITIILLAIATIFAALFILNRNNNATKYIYLSISIIFCFAYGIFQALSNKKKNAEDSQKAKEYDSNVKKKIYEFKDLNNTASFIYESFINNNTELSEIIKNTPCDITYDYDDEEKEIYMMIDNVVGMKQKDAFVLVISSSKNKQMIEINDQEKDVTNLEYNEIKNIIFKAIKDNVKIDNNVDFEIRNSKFELYFCGFFGIAGLIAVIVFIILKVLNKVNNDTFIGILCFGLFFGILGTVGVLWWFREKFSLKDGIYTYRGLKTRSCNAKDVKEVIILTSTSIKILFVDKNNQKLIKFRDIGRAFSGGSFKKSLNYYKIPMKIDTESYSGI